MVSADTVISPEKNKNFFLHLLASKEFLIVVTSYILSISPHGNVSLESKAFYKEKLKKSQSKIC